LLEATKEPDLRTYRFIDLPLILLIMKSTDFPEALIRIHQAACPEYARKPQANELII
jgi:hypothetical protein